MGWQHWLMPCLVDAKHQEENVLRLPIHMLGTRHVGIIAFAIFKLKSTEYPRLNLKHIPEYDSRLMLLKFKSF